MPHEEEKLDSSFLYANEFIMGHQVVLPPRAAGRTSVHTICTLRYFRKQWWRWDDGLWAPLEGLSDYLNHWLATHGCTSCKRQADGVMPLLKARLVLHTKLEPPFFLGKEVGSGNERVGGAGVSLIPHTKTKTTGFITGIDGHLTVPSMEFTATDPSVFLQHRLPYSVKPLTKKPQMPVFTKFLEETLPDPDMRDLIQEWFGYCLLPSTEMQKAMFWEGGGSNGKSVLIEILRQFVGTYNCSAVPLGQLSKRFQALPTVGKLVNLCTDTSERDTFDEGMLKAFIGGDIQYADVKNQKGIEYTPTARLVVAYNERPRFFDKSRGMWRRMIVVDFPNRVAEKDKIRAFTNGRASDWPFRAELPSIFRWALVGLLRLLKRGDFEPPESCEMAVSVYRAESNPVVQFVDEMCACEAGYRLPRKTLYTAYRKYCEDYGFLPLGVILFKKELERYLHENGKVFSLVRPENKPWHFKGITLKAIAKPSAKSGRRGLGRLLSELTPSSGNGNGEGQS